MVGSMILAIFESGSTLAGWSWGSPPSSPPRSRSVCGIALPFPMSCGVTVRSSRRCVTCVCMALMCCWDSCSLFAICSRGRGRVPGHAEGCAWRLKELALCGALPVLRRVTRGLRAMFVAVTLLAESEICELLEFEVAIADVQAT